MVMAAFAVGAFPAHAALNINSGANAEGVKEKRAIFAQCRKTALDDYNAALKNGRDAYLSALKGAQSEYKSAISSAKSAHTASMSAAKGLADKVAKKTAIKTANEIDKSVRENAVRGWQEAKKTARNAWSKAKDAAKSLHSSALTVCKSAASGT